MAACKFSLLVRQFSTSGVTHQLVKPPIQVFGMGGRYATALYSAAMKEKKLEVIEKELKSVEETMKKNAILSNFVANPVIRKQDKISILTEFMKGQKMSPITINFFGVMADNNRLGKLKEVLNAWGQIMSAHRGEVVCKVTTAKSMDASQQKEVMTALQGFLDKKEVIKLNMAVDSTILGGMVVEIGDKYIDMSTATQVKNMTNLIKQSI
ncbi:ATP synthase subunit O, mitochondrial-like [Asterias rubens]|uniref:ATP synthase subunit O, mitochondrial-like n=1 Tax=Asterias rubens TaxID=7604 RepID=UPI0014557560|nr:ATP synthase subunit O, mitochondrial-like [Asterias rubens]